MHVVVASDTDARRQSPVPAHCASDAGPSGLLEPLRPPGACGARKLALDARQAPILNDHLGERLSPPQTPPIELIAAGRFEIQLTQMLAGGLLLRVGDRERLLPVTPANRPRLGDEAPRAAALPAKASRLPPHSSPAQRVPRGAVLPKRRPMGLYSWQPRTFLSDCAVVAMSCQVGAHMLLRSRDLRGSFFLDVPRPKSLMPSGVKIESSHGELTPGET